MSAAQVTVPGHQILEHLGSGASGEVFRAETSDGLARAVKVLSSGGFSKLERLRFLRELVGLLEYGVDGALGRCRSFEGRYSDALPHFRAAAKQARPRQQCDGRLSLRLLGLEP